ncbi:MAG: acyltransferase [Sulfuritalea sp.]|nr:acyltransferase [Sulfuritalea sp.]
MSFYSEEELDALGLAKHGQNVKISRKAAIYNSNKVSIGSNVRIDDFCVLSAGEGGIELGDYVHIAVFCSLMGAGRIKLEDFSGLSSRVSIYSSNDDYSGATLTNPTVPSEFSGVTHGDVAVGKHVIVGAGAVILPGVILEQGVAIGSLSLVQKHCFEFGIYLGVPARRVGERKQDLLQLEQQLRMSGCSKKAKE